MIKERRPWEVDQQKLVRPQRFQDNWVKFNNWPGERGNWRNNPRYGEGQRRNWEPIRRLDSYRNLANQNNNYGQFRPNYERRWNQGPRNPWQQRDNYNQPPPWQQRNNYNQPPPWQQRNNYNQPRIQGYEQPRLQWKGQNFQARAEPNGNAGPEHANQAGRPGPSYWMKETDKTISPREKLAITNGKEDKSLNNRRALN